MVGSIGSVYRSVENLDETCIASNQAKNLLLNPAYSSRSKNALFLTEPSRTTETTCIHYACNNSLNNSRTMFNSSCRNYCTDVCYTSRPGCGGLMTWDLRYVGAPKPEKATEAAAGCESGVAKGAVTYTVMDDLTVMRMSAISSITLLNKFNVKDVSSLVEGRVKLGINEVHSLIF